MGTHIHGRPLRRLGYIAMDHAMHPKYPCVVGSGVFFGVQQRPLPLRARVLLGRLIHNTRHGAILANGRDIDFLKNKFAKGYKELFKSGSGIAAYDV